MFCPECRAEYRPGFTRCSDCDVDLVQELSEPDAHVRKLKRDWALMLPAGSRKTIHWWAFYKRQTGTWPWSSVAIHFINWVVVLFGGVFLFWWTVVEHHFSEWQWLGTLVIVSITYFILADWAKSKVKLNLLRNRKRLAKLRPGFRL